MDIEIRLERPEEYRAVEELTKKAFWNVHAPGCDEHYLVHILRDDASFVPELDFVALVNGQLVGNIMYSMGYVEAADGKRHDLLLFGPLSVLPEYQRKGVGTALMRHSAEAARKLGYKVVMIYGDPDYYSRVGFRAASDFGIMAPDGEPSAALQAWELEPGALAGISGKFHEAAVYETIDPAKVEAFDKDFPQMEKGFAPSQLRFQALSGRSS